MNSFLKFSAAVLSSYAFLNQASAQVAKTSVVEHFTNSNCSICASSNPTFFSNLGNFPNALHIAYHPSSPYASCYFSKQNTSENDARTNYYGIYGSTPRFIINGEVSTVSNMSSKLTAQASEQSNFSIKVKQTAMATDSVKVHIVITKVAQDTTTLGLLYAAVKEDTIFYTTGNGEKTHRNVFRKALAGINGQVINMPVQVNDSAVYEYNYKMASTWQKQRIQSMAIVQWPGNKKLINAAVSAGTIAEQTLNTAKLASQKIAVYPNPASNELVFEGLQTITNYRIYNSTGKLMTQGQNQGKLLDVSKLNTGIYFVKINSNNKIYTAQFSINR